MTNKASPLRPKVPLGRSARSIEPYAAPFKYRRQIHDGEESDEAGAVVRRASRQQVVHLTRGRRGGRGGNGELDLAYPKVDADKEKELDCARAALSHER